MKVRDLMTHHVRTVGPSDSVATAYDVMDAEHFRHLPVVDDEGQLIGILSSRDITRATAGSDLPISALREMLKRINVDEVMNTAPETTEAGTALRDAAEMILEYKLGCLPVVEGTQLVGILTESDFVRYVAEG